MPDRDDVYRRPHSQLVDFTFDERVAEVFPDMIRRSVPGYETVIPMTGLMAARALRDAGADRPRAYDLGCSLGATALAIARQMGDRPCEIVGVDNAAAMIERARALIRDPRITLRCEDVRDTALDAAQAATLNYVLQFLPPADRLEMLRRIRGALAPNGVLLLSEKIRFEDADTQRDFEAAHLDFKRANGYSELEISQKRSALENVMIVDTEEIHRARLAAAGFTRVRRWYQCLNWAGFEARP